MIITGMGRLRVGMTRIMRRRQISRGPGAAGVASLAGWAPQAGGTVGTWHAAPRRPAGGGQLRLPGPSGPYPALAASDRMKNWIGREPMHKCVSDADSTDENVFRTGSRYKYRMTEKGMVTSSDHMYTSRIPT